VVCIEHHLDVLKSADWVIDLGPEAGDAGGYVVVCGPPETVAEESASHTGVALKPILAAGPRVERPVYDLAAHVRAEIDMQKPVRLEEGDVSTRMPWQRDGRQWHTVLRTDHCGRPVQWDPQLLIWWVETIEKIGGFAPADWNDRAHVEIKAPGSKTQWFMHALTGARWLLQVYVRVPIGTFHERKLIDQLAVKTLDERTDLPIYGQGSRVVLRKSSRSFEDVRLHLHDFKDVDKAAFESFLRQAAQAYFQMVERTQSAPDKGEPWKTDGRQWHLSQRGITKQYDVLWKPTALVELLGRFNKLVPDIETIWTGKVAIALRTAGQGRPFGSIVTNQRWGLRVELKVPRSSFTFVQVDRLGKEPKIHPREDHDVVQFWVQRLTDNDPSQLVEVLRAAAGRGTPSGEPRTEVGEPMKQKVGSHVSGDGTCLPAAAVTSA
jgi:excinuclease ABC subunit A